MKKFEIQNRYGLKLVGEISEPENSKGLVFVLHGFSDTKESVSPKTLADEFLKNNYTVVNFDATNSTGESDGKCEEATLGKHYEDLIDVINWAKTQNFYVEPFLLSGHSMGAYAVLQYAEDFPKEVKGVFAFAPVISGELSLEANKIFHPEELISWQKTGWKKIVSKSRPGLEINLPYSHMIERQKHDLTTKVDNLTMPIAIIVGADDSSCPPEHQKILFDLLKCRKELYVIKDARHNFRTEEHLNELKKYIHLWLSKI